MLTKPQHEGASGLALETWEIMNVNPTGYPQIVDELNGSGVVTRTYTYGLQRISEDQVINSTWTPSFYGYDGMGSVRNLTNAAGAVTDKWEYDAFGNAWTVSGTTPNEFLYRGEQYDSDLGLYYLRARYYNPVTGRFMSRDPEDGKPIDPKTLHKYLYAGGDPVNWVDPRGRGATLEFLFTTADISTPTEAAVAGLTQGAAQWAAIAQLYAGTAYLTAQDILVEIETAETTGIIIKFLACEYIGTEVTEFLSNGNNTELQKFIVGEVFSHGCFDYIEPYPF
jgi:RHS repeat-associated protein